MIEIRTYNPFDVPSDTVISDLTPYLDSEPVASGSDYRLALMDLVEAINDDRVDTENMFLHVVDNSQHSITLDQIRERALEIETDTMLDNEQIAQVYELMKTRKPEELDDTIRFINQPD